MGKKSFFSFPKAAVTNSDCKLESPRVQWGKKIPVPHPWGLGFHSLGVRPTMGIV